MGENLRSGAVDLWQQFVQSVHRNIAGKVWCQSDSRRIERKENVSIERASRLHR